MVELDVLGQACPIPVVKSIKMIDEMARPDVLAVHVDNDIAVENLLKMASSKGFSAKSEQLDDRHYIVSINVEDEVVVEAKGSGSYVVAIASSGMGVGDEDLSKTLMKGFIFALSQQEELPSHILFYNSGAYISTEGSASLEDLKSLEERGVEIITCGACLDFYQLKEKLSVGSVGNMYSIVEIMRTADKVIKP